MKTKIYAVLSIFFVSLLVAATANRVSQFDEFKGGTFTGTTVNADNLTLDTNTISSTNTNGDIILDPNGTGDVIFNDLTATTVPYLGASKEILSSAITPTELGYITGVTSSLCGIDDTCSLTNKTMDDDTNNIHADVVHILVRNVSGGTLSLGQPVYISDYNSGQDRVEVSLAEADVTASMPAVGLVEADILNNANGEVVVSGVLSGLDTSSWSVGDSVYVSTTAGVLTNVRPSSNGDLVQSIAKVNRSHATLGVVTIQGAGRSNAIPNNLTMVNGGMFRTGTTAADTALIAAYDVDGAAYTTFATLTANNTPTFVLSPTSIDIGDGAVGTPSLSFTSDTDNGLYYVGADNWALGAGGYKAIDVKKSTGAYANIGLPTASTLDTVPFYIQRNSASPILARVDNANAGASAAAAFQFNGNGFNSYIGSYSSANTNTSLAGRAMVWNLSGNGVSLIAGVASTNVGIWAGGIADANEVTRFTYEGAQTMMQEIATPTTPASTTNSFYFKSDAKAYILDDAGTELQLLTGSLDVSNAPYNLQNVAVDNSVGSSAMTVTLEQSGGGDCTGGSPCKIALRSSTITSGVYNSRSVSAALSVVITSGATLGHSNATDGFIYVYAIDNAGTVELAVSSVMQDELSLQTTTTISASADDDGFYSTTGRSNVPIRLIGRLTSNQTTAGTWAAIATAATPGFMAQDNKLDHKSGDNSRVFIDYYLNVTTCAVALGGEGISSTSHTATGECKVNFDTDLFSNVPRCGCAGLSTVGIHVSYDNNAVNDDDTVTHLITRTDTGAQIDTAIACMCVGD